MRTNVDIDGALLVEALIATGLATKKSTVEEALRRLVRHRQQREAIAATAGIGWEGDLAALRTGEPGWS